MCRVYITSPPGFTESTKHFMNRVLIPAVMAAEVEAINPWRDDGRAHELFTAISAMPSIDQRRIIYDELLLYLGKRNEEDIKKCEGIIAVLDGIDVDSGTAVEIGYGAALKKWIIGYRKWDRSRHEAIDNCGVAVVS
jgi:nucleoside 2-deoxyribosyltransferase